MNRLLFTLATVLTFSGALHCQVWNHEIDSLKDLSHVATSEEARVNKLYNIGRMYFGINYDSAIKYLSLSDSLANEINYGLGLAKNRAWLARVLIRRNGLDTAMTLLRQSERIRELENDTTGLAESYDFIGSVYQMKGQYDSMSFYYFKSLELSELTGNTNAIASSYFYLGVGYSVLGRQNKSLESLRKALEINGIKDRLLEAKVLNSIGIAFYNKSLLDSALYYLEGSVNAIIKYEGMSPRYHQRFGSIAAIYKKQGKVKEAIEFSKRTLSVQKLMGDSLSIAFTLNILADCLSGLDEHETAFEYYLLAEKYSKNYSLPVIRSVVSKIAASLVSFGRPEEAISYYERYLVLSDSLKNTEREKFARELEEKFENDKLSLENETISLKLFQLSVITLVTILLVVIAIGFLIFLNQKKKKANVRIDQLLQQREINSLQGVLAGQEEERQRIATDLHDKLGAILGMVKLHFSAVEDRIDDLKEDNRHQYEKANELLDQASTEVRNISHNLLSGVLVKFGLIPALHDLKDTVESTGKLKVQLITGDQMEIRLKGEQELQIYRIVQELISNILKHSKATEATIQLNRTNGEINLLVQDDGVGFDIEKAKQKEGIGLKNLEARAAKLNASIHFDSGKGAGTTVSIDIPIEKDIL